MIAKTMRRNVRKIVTAYCKATGLTKEQASAKFYSGRIVFFDGLIRKKHGVTYDKLDEILNRMREEWPENVPWPDCEPMVMSGPKRKGTEE